MFDDCGLVGNTCIHGPICREVKCKTQCLRLQRVYWLWCKGQSQWRLNSAGIFDKNCTVFDNALVTKLYILSVFPTPISTIINVCGLEEQEDFQKYTYLVITEIPVFRHWVEFFLNFLLSYTHTFNVYVFSPLLLNMAQAFDRFCDSGGTMWNHSLTTKYFSCNFTGFHAW